MKVGFQRAIFRLSLFRGPLLEPFNLQNYTVNLFVIGAELMDLQTQSVGLLKCYLEASGLLLGRRIGEGQAER